MTNFTRLIKIYYLPWLVIFLIAFGLRSCSDIFSGDPNTVYDSVLLTSSFSIVSSLILGSIFLYANEYWGPKKLAKNLTREPLVCLKKIGFDLTDNSYNGEFNGFRFNVSYSPMGGKNGSQAIYITCLYNPIRFNSPLSQSTIKKLNKKYEQEKLEWNLGTVAVPVSYYFKRPGMERILKAMQSIMEVLHAERLQPITAEDAKKLDYEQLLAHSNYIVSDSYIVDYKKPWILRYGWLFWVPVIAFVIRSSILFGMTFIDYKMLLAIALVVGLLLSFIIYWLNRELQDSKTNLILGAFVFGAFAGNVAFLEVNYQLSDAQMQVYGLPILDKDGHGSGSNEKLYIFVEHQGLYKQINIPVEYRDAIHEIDSLMIGTSKGYFRSEVIKAMQLK